MQKIIENYPQYNADWLLTGNGKMKKEPFDVEDDSVQVVDKYSIEFLLGRYESLAVENAKLQEELNEVKRKRYLASDDNTHSLVAEPRS